MFKVLAFLGLSGVLTLWVLAEQSKKASSFSKAMITVLTSSPLQPEGEVQKSKEEWEQILSPLQYHVLINEATEPPHGPIYEQFKEQGEGTYYCAACNAELFASAQKFDSRSGWPSFYAPSVEDNITLDVDHKLGYKRTEVRCGTCQGHLGHVFEGEGFDTPTDLRYCINGICLHFLPAEAEKE